MGMNVPNRGFRVNGNHKAEFLKLPLPDGYRGIQKDRTFQLHIRMLEEALGERLSIGRVWFPDADVILGAEAGHALRRILLEGPDDIHRPETSILRELGLLVLHRAGRLHARGAIALGPQMLRDRLASSRAKPIYSLTTLRATHLP